MTQTFVVTGATGHVGRAVVAHLAAAGIVPRVLSRQPDAAWAVPVERVTGDLADPAALGRLFAGATCTFLVSTIERDPAIDREVLAAATAAGVRHVVKLSTIAASPSSVVGDSAIGARHREREHDLAASALTWTVLRPGFFMSNVLQWRDMLRAGDTVIAPVADAAIAPISPRDIALVASLALRDPERHARATYELTGDQLITVREQVAILGSLLGRALVCHAVSPEVAAERALARGVPPAVVESLQRMWTATAAGANVAGAGGFRTTTFAELTGHAPESFAAWAGDHVPGGFAR